MITEPDGVEVVATAADAAGLSRPPLLVLDRVVAFLDVLAAAGGGAADTDGIAADAGGIAVLGAADHPGYGPASAPLAWQRIGDGQSNVTYLLERGDARFVLRRGPRPPLPRSTHDMLREARVQQGLARVGVPVPRILAVCEDDAVLGVPFYLMEYLDGEIILGSAPPALDSVAARRATSEALVDTLVSLHGVDLDAAGLANFGRAEGYLERQLATFSALAGQVSERSLPLVAELGTWLEAHRPATQRHALVHGDYRFGNVLFRRDEPKVAAVLDWEMSALGDPLADLGYLTATYCDAAFPSTVMDITTATLGEGYLDRAGIAARYAAGSGLDLTPLPWYQALALWKSSVFLEAIYTRWRRGERPGDAFAPSLEYEVPRILEAARDITRDA